jgi:hypothetical protein
MMETLSLHYKARRVTRFILIQFLALAGWIVVQLGFSLSPFGKTLPLLTIMLTESIWWIALLFIMLRLFLREYQHFVQAAFDLEEANGKLRQRTNDLLENIRRERFPEESREATNKDGLI